MEGGGVHHTPKQRPPNADPRSFSAEICTVPYPTLHALYFSRLRSPVAPRMLATNAL